MYLCIMYIWKQIAMRDSKVITLISHKSDDAPYYARTVFCGIRT